MGNTMNMIQRYQQTTCTVKEAKLNIFAPYEKKQTEHVNTIVYEDTRYKVELKGFRLNQTHRDLLDIASYFGDNSLEQKVEDKRPLRTFSLYEVQKHLNYKCKNNNKWIDDKFSEIQQSIIKITDKSDGSWVQFNIIDVAQYSQKINRYAMVISELYMLFFENEISVGWKDYLKDILSLNAQSRALARFILSHSNSFTIGLDKAMEKIGIDKSKMTPKSFRANRRKILENRDELKLLNILIKESADCTSRNQNYIIEYKLLPKIQIYHPMKNEAKI